MARQARPLLAIAAMGTHFYPPRNPLGVPRARWAGSLRHGLHRLPPRPHLPHAPLRTQMLHRRAPGRLVSAHGRLRCPALDSRHGRLGNSRTLLPPLLSSPLLASSHRDWQNLKATGAAHAHNLHLHPDDPPPKVWPSGYCKLAAATCATVFWGGETFAPKRRIARSEHLGAWGAGGREEVSVQEFLQVRRSVRAVRRS